MLTLKTSSEMAAMTEELRNLGRKDIINKHDFKFEIFAALHFQLTLIFRCLLRTSDTHRDNFTGRTERRWTVPCGTLENQMTSSTAHRPVSGFNLKSANWRTTTADQNITTRYAMFRQDSLPVFNETLANPSEPEKDSNVSLIHFRTIYQNKIKRQK